LSLGFDPKNVRHILATHLHIDHISGAIDFPEAEVHTTYDEWHARERVMRRQAGGAEVRIGERLRLHSLDGPPALGFPASHDVFGDGTVLLLDAKGHTHGAVAVAVKLKERWLLHVGDSAMFREDYASAGQLSVHARVMAADARALEATRACIRAAETEHGALVVASHDDVTFATLPTTVEKGFAAAWDEDRKKKQRNEQPREAQARR
jgi:glyoxylase-like metal-dependent hydrolase (beta-lactamase superfamily II)